MNEVLAGRGPLVTARRRMPAVAALAVTGMLAAGVLAGGGPVRLPGSGVPAVDETPHTAAAAAGDRSCRRTRRVVTVRFSLERWPAVADHVRDTRARLRLLHIDREHADQHRRDSLRGIPTRPGMERDELPPAMSREGGKGADVRLIPARENESSGAYLGGRLRHYCNGQAFRLAAAP